MNQVHEQEIPEIPKYIKQKESNISKAKKKSKHKHQYKECLIQYKQNYNFLSEKQRNEIHTTLSSYCIICGKIGSWLDKNSIVTDYLTTVDNTLIGNNNKRITEEELYKKYHDKLPVFFVEDYWKDGYVNLEENEK